MTVARVPHIERRLAQSIRIALFSVLFAIPTLTIQAYADTSTLDASTLKTYSIPAGPLGRTLANFAAETGIALSFDPALTEGRNNAALKGNFSSGRDAVTHLLNGSGLEILEKADGSYTLRLASQGETTLRPVKVQAETERGVTTEGIGSYITRATSAATGLTLSPRETPQSVSVMTRQRIDDQNLQSLAEVLNNAPGVATSQLDSERTTFSARGFAVDDFQYDGISTNYKSQYAAGESEVDSVLYDRVEIVRGATGLLTGAGQPSASINLVRKHANSKEFKGQASFGVGSWNNYRGTLDLSAPVSADGRIRARLVAAYEDKESFIDRYERTRNTLYGVIDADLTAATTLSVGISRQESNADQLTYGGPPLWYSDGSATDFDRSFSTAPDWAYEDTEIINTFASLEHRFNNDWTVQTVLMRGKHEVENARLFVWGYPDRETGLQSESPSRVQFPGERIQTSADVKLSGPFEALGREHEGILGFSYSKNEADFDRIGASSAAVPLSIDDFYLYPEPTWGAATLSERYDTKQTAAYGALRLSLADALKLIVGGRFNTWDKSGAGYLGRNPYSYDKNKFTPYVGVVYDLSASYSTYASYTTIFKPQDLRDRNGTWLEPLYGDSYEAGLKGEFIDGKLNGSVAVFKTTQDNLGQADGSNRVPGTTIQAYYEAEGATSKGVELEISGELAPGWNLAFDAAHFKAKDADDEDFNTHLPRNTLHLFTTYRLPGAWRQLTVGGGVNWQSRIYYDLPDGPVGLVRQEQSSYMTASLMGRYEFTEQLSLQLNAYNLFDKKYQTAVNWYGQAAWGTPRNLQATLNYTF